MKKIIMTVNSLIKRLELLPHPEGGYYKETYRSSSSINCDGFDGERNICTAIYFLLERGNISHLHRIKSDELWFFHEGNALEVVVLDEKESKIITLGKELEKGEAYQAIVPAGSWFGARLKDNNGYALVSCTVAPGFDFRDFELAKSNELIEKFPDHELLITQMSIE